MVAELKAVVNMYVFRRCVRVWLGQASLAIVTTSEGNLGTTNLQHINMLSQLSRTRLDDDEALIVTLTDSLSH